jgi:hypothetical protein
LALKSDSVIPQSIGKHKQEEDDLQIPWRKIPFDRNKYYYGRDTELATLHGAFKQGPNPSLRTCVVHGLAGVGKTQLCIQYVYECGEDYDAIFWIPSDTPTKITTSMSNAAIMFGLCDLNTASDTVTGANILRLWLQKTSTFSPAARICFDSANILT